MTMDGQAPEEAMVLRLGHSRGALRPSLTNGPWWRVSMWTQGCSLLCTTTCLNPHFLSRRGGFEVEIGVLLERLRALRESEPDLEGVSILGGEPFDQAEPVAELC